MASQPGVRLSALWSSSREGGKMSKDILDEMNETWAESERAAHEEGECFADCQLCASEDWVTLDREGPVAFLNNQLKRRGLR
jgi:hypothetical protein